jgi:hypothetical protein
VDLASAVRQRRRVDDRPTGGRDPAHERHYDTVVSAAYRPHRVQHAVRQAPPPPSPRRGIKCADRHNQTVEGHVGHCARRSARTISIARIDPAHRNSRRVDSVIQTGIDKQGLSRTLRGVLDGVDAVDWASLDRTYISDDDDEAGVLRAVASEDQETADRAFEALREWISHQGTIYRRTTACIPFLVELAQLARFNRAELIWQAGYVADPRRTGGPEHDNIRAALASSVDGINALLGDEDAQIRANAVYARTQHADAECMHLLAGRLVVEEDEQVRASLLVALGEVAPDVFYDDFVEAMATGGPRERLAAAVAIGRAGLDWPPGSAGVLARLVVGGVELGLPWFLSDRAVDEVVQRTPHAAIVRDATTIALRTPTSQTAPRPRFAQPVGAESVLYLLQARCETSRHGPHELIDLLGPLLTSRDTEIRSHAVMYLSEIGAAALAYVELLADIARQPSDAAASLVLPSSVFAMRALVRLSHPAWVDSLCTAWATGRRVDLGGTTRWPRYRAVTPALITTIEDRLRWATNPLVVAGLAHFAAETGTGDLESALRAAQAIAPDAVLEALVRVGRATDADLDAAIHLRTPYRHGDLYAAIELCRRGVGTEALVGAIERRKDKPAFVLRQIVPVAHHLHEHRDLLRSFLTGDTSRHSDVHVYAARCLLHAGEAEPANTIVRTALRDRWARDAAAQLAQDLGDPTLEPDLRTVLEHDTGNIHAAEALVSLGASPDEFAATLHDWLHRRWSIDPNDIEAKCRALASPAAAALIDKLADSDERTVTGGDLSMIIWEDELLQSTLDRIRRTPEQDVR